MIQVYNINVGILKTKNVFKGFKNIYYHLCDCPIMSEQLPIESKCHTCVLTDLLGSIM